eukprot:415265_1
MKSNQEMIAAEITAASKQSNPDEIEIANDNESKPTGKKELKFDAEFYSQYDANTVDEAIQQYLITKENTKYPKPFIHHDLMLHEKEHFWHSKAVPDANDEEYKCELCDCSMGISSETRQKYGITKNFRQRLRRALFVISTPVIFLIIATYLEVALNVIIGGALLAMFSLYIAQVLFYVLSAKLPDSELYRIYSVSGKPDNWANINTAYLQLMYKKESLQSISELSAINGGITKTMLNTLGAYTWAAVSVHFAGQLYYNRCVFNWDVADMFEIMGTGGIVLISIFELDPFSKAMQTAHYIGVMFAALCPAGYCIQQYYIGQKFIFAVILYVIAFAGLALFVICGWATDQAQLESKRKWNKNFELTKLSCLVPVCFKKKNVNTYSKMNIIFEATAIYLTTVALCLWLIEYDKDCKYGCAGLKEYCQY